MRAENEARRSGFEARRDRTWKDARDARDDRRDAMRGRQELNQEIGALNEQSVPTQRPISGDSRAPCWSMPATPCSASFIWRNRSASLAPRAARTCRKASRRSARHAPRLSAPPYRSARRRPAARRLRRPMARPCRPTARRSAGLRLAASTDRSMSSRRPPVWSSRAAARLHQPVYVQPPPAGSSASRRLLPSELRPRLRLATASSACRSLASCDSSARPTET